MCICVCVFLIIADINFHGCSPIAAAQCQFQDYCGAGLPAGAPIDDSAVLNSPNTIDDAVAYLPTIYSSSPCAGNRAGVLCYTCAPGYRSLVGTECSRCPHSTTSWVFIILISLALIAFIVLLYWIMLRSGQDTMQNTLTPQSDTTINQDEVNGAAAPEDDEEASSVNSSLTNESDYSNEQSELDSHDDNDSDIDSHQSDHVKSNTDSEIDTDADAAATTDMPSGSTDPASEDPIASARPPPPPPDFTYKLKMLVTFLQISSALVINLDMQWPPLFKEVISYLGFINFDYFLSQITSAQCFPVITYYRELLAILLTPLVIAALVIVLYLIPRYFEILCFRHASIQERQRSKMRFWKMTLWTLYLIYPGISFTVLGLYVCRSFQLYSSTSTTSGYVDLLWNHMNVVCHTPTWNFYALVCIGFIILYPVGIPLLFYTLMRVNLGHLYEPRIRAQIGFLYAGMKQGLWWFELLDCLNKLFLTSLLPFFPTEAQLPLGMCICVLYFMLSIYLNPYIRMSDDLLHQLVLTEILLILVCGWVFYSTSGFSDADNLSVSITLLAACALVIIVFAFQFIRTFSTVLNRTYRRIHEHIRDATRASQSRKIMQPPSPDDSKANGTVQPAQS